MMSVKKYYHLDEDFLQTDFRDKLARLAKNIKVFMTDKRLSVSTEAGLSFKDRAISNCYRAILKKYTKGLRYPRFNPDRKSRRL